MVFTSLIYVVALLNLCLTQTFQHYVHINIRLGHNYLYLYVMLMYYNSILHHNYVIVATTKLHLLQKLS